MNNPVLRHSKRIKGNFWKDRTLKKKCYLLIHIRINAPDPIICLSGIFAKKQKHPIKNAQPVLGYTDTKV